jgi:drug/metabolite transporter (DMT)-like permease
LDLIVFLAVLGAAVLHASWNVLVKLNLDRFLSLFLLQTLMGVMGVAMLAVFPWPSPASLPYALVSGLLHTGYNLFLARAYRTGDLSQVYPIARGTAPLLALLGSALFVHEPITTLAVAGIVILVGGIWMIAFGGGKHLRLDRVTLFYALGTSIFIGVYTLVDGLGGRVSGAPSGYAAMVFVLDAIFLATTAIALRGPGVVTAVAPFWRSGLLGAVLSTGGYWIVIWAMTKAPIATVAALRETSILFVLVMSHQVLRERLSSWRVSGALLIVGGAVALRMS